MKKFLMVILAVMLLVAAAFAVNSGQNSAVPCAVSGLGSVDQVIVGPYTMTGFQITYNSNTATAEAANDYFLLGDAANTYTAYSQTITLTAKDLNTTDGYFKLGEWGLATNGSGYGIVSGIKFTNGVVLSAGPLGVTVTGVAEGK